MYFVSGLFYILPNVFFSLQGLAWDDQGGAGFDDYDYGIYG